MKRTHKLIIHYFTKGILAATASIMIFTTQGWASEIPQNPRLVLQITVDPLRGDLPRRNLRKIGADGFRYLPENGVVYENAHHCPQVMGNAGLNEY